MDTSFILPVVMILVWGVQAIISTASHRKERADMMSRIMSKSLPEYVQARQDLATISQPLPEEPEPVKIDDGIVPINEIEKDPIIMQQFLNSIRNNKQL